MRVWFEVDGASAEFSYNRFTGGAGIRIGGESFRLQSPWNPLTHLDFRPTRTWVRQVHKQKITIELRRPHLLAPLRSWHYLVKVDNKIVAEHFGR